MCGIHGQRGGRSHRPQAVAIPDLALQVFGLAKQRAAPVSRDHQAGARLGEPGQVIKIAVVAKEKITVPVALAFWRCGDDRDTAFTEHRGKAGTPLGMDGCL